jgi:catechol 2,3-dioxygenase-like lactoylglutathione lyase family enzyme
MKRFHVHVAVHDLEQSIRFYKALFDAEPTREAKAACCAPASA